MAKFLSLCIVLLTASISVSAQTYTVLHFFGSKPGDPHSPRLPELSRKVVAALC